MSWKASNKNHPNFVSSEIIIFFSVNLVVELSNSDVIEKEVTALTTGSTVYP